MNYQKTKRHLLDCVNELMKEYKVLYGNIDISLPMSDDEKRLKKLINRHHSVLNKLVRKERNKPC